MKGCVIIFSQTVEYAIRAMVVLAQYACDSDRAVGNAAIAQRAQVPPTYLSKVMQSLVRAGLVGAKRGAGGGFVLLRKPTNISVLEVVNAVSPIRRVRSCPLNLKTHCERLCPMHARLDEAMAHIEGALQSSSLADLLHEPNRPAPMLETLLPVRLD